MAGPWDVVKTEPASGGDPWAVVSTNPAPNAGPPPATGTISAAPTGVRAWLDNLESDVRYGGSSTIPGKILQMMGATGVNRGVSEGAAEKVASPVLGTIKAAQGIAQIPSQPVQGALKTASGALQAAEIPLAFAGNAPGTAEAVMGKTIPSVMKEQAAQKFMQVMQDAKNVPVNVENAGQIALETQGLASRGGSMPKVVRDFLRRVTEPDSGPLTYKEARDFYSNATRLSADEFNRLTPVMRAQVSKFTNALGQSIGEAANTAGQGENYSQAMQQFARGAQGQKAINAAVKYGVTTAAGAGAAGALAKYLLQKSH